MQTSAVPDQASHLKELLRKHKIGELTKHQADEAARTIVAEEAKRGGDRKSEDYKSKHNLCIDSSQSDRAKENKVHRNTQAKLDKLTAHPALLAKVKAGQISVHAAAIEAGIVKRPTPLDELKRAWTRASEADALAGKILAQPANKPGNPTGSNQYQKKEELDNLTNSTQKARAKENGVHRKTQEKLDRLARDRPDLLERVCAGELKVT